MFLNLLIEEVLINNLCMILRTFLLIFLMAETLCAQEIKLKNNSFEARPQPGLAPEALNPSQFGMPGWLNCGAYSETVPDIQPGQFECFEQPFNGLSYLGLVVRDNNTCEAIGQELSSPMKAGQIYTFSVYAQKPQRYYSLTKASRKYVDFVNPIRIRIWGGRSACEKSELLDESGTIKQSEWKQVSFKLKPKSDYAFLIIEAYYTTPSLSAYCGCVLIDFASNLVPDKTPPNAIASTKPKQPTPLPGLPTNPPNTKPKPNPEDSGKGGGSLATSPKATGSNGGTPNPITPTPEVAKQEVFKGTIDAKTLKEGQVFRIDNLYFKADEASLTKTSFASMEELFQFLNINKGVIIEIGGHTNGLPKDDYCDNLSSKRAKSVADILVQKGIAANRIVYKGYGKRQPIASDASEEGRRKNQRVEIKILKVHGLNE
jgi:outer membrane protein OmpA-like peptidoglycan-associated protein